MLNLKEATECSLCKRPNPLNTVDDTGAKIKPETAPNITELAKIQPQLPLLDIKLEIPILKMENFACEYKKPKSLKFQIDSPIND